MAFFLEFRKELTGHNDSTHRIELRVEVVVGFGIDGGEQLLLLLTYINHCFIDRNAIRALPINRLQTKFLQLIMYS